jgi:predicted AlkP superfamily pyrophosphatase or phosphodiesterase
VRRVVLVVLDGLRADAIDALELRHWKRLATTGSSSRLATTVAPSVTAACMASLLTGVPPQVHGLGSSRFHLPKSRGPVDPLPRVLAEAGQPTSGFVREVPLVLRGVGRRIARHLGVATASFRGTCCREILFAAWSQLASQERGLVLLHWPDADAAGHAHGWMSGAYAEAAQRLDQALGLLAALADVEEDPGTLLVALADHGGGGRDPKDHDSDHPLDRTIPLLLAGHCVTGGELDDPTLLDVPATVLWALGVPLPASYQGRPLVEAFEPVRVAALA